MKGFDEKRNKKRKKLKTRRVQFGMSGLGKRTVQVMSINKVPKPETLETNTKQSIIFIAMRAVLTVSSLTTPCFFKRCGEWRVVIKISDSVASTDNHDTQLCLVRNSVSSKIFENSVWDEWSRKDVVPRRVALGCTSIWHEWSRKDR
ncbi:uncharacterized protein LOC144573227 [Carex rostrata]